MHHPFANPRPGTILRSPAFVSELRMEGHPSEPSLTLANDRVSLGWQATRGWAVITPSERTHRQAKDVHRSAQHEGGPHQRPRTTTTPQREPPLASPVVVHSRSSAIDAIVGLSLDR